MKKILVLAALLSQVQAEGVTGSKFYLDLGLGVTNMYGAVRGTTARTEPYDGSALNRNYYEYFSGNIRSGWGGTQFSSLLNVGYDCKMRDSLVVMGMFAGGGYSGGLYGAPYDVQKQIYTGDAGIFAAEPASGQVVFREKGRINAGFRMGIAACSFFPHIRLGWTMHFMGAQINRPNADTFQMEKYKVSKGVSALTVGCGVDYQVTNSFILGAIFDVSLGGKTRFNFAKKNILWAPGNVDDKLSIRLKPTFSTFMVTAKWAFPTCN